MNTLYDNPKVGDLVMHKTAFACDVGQVISITDTTIVMETTDPERATVTFTKNAAGQWEADY